MFGYKKLVISLFTLLMTVASQQSFADVSEELEFVGKIASSKSVGVIILRDKVSRRTIVTQLGRAFTYEGIVYSVAEVINQGAVVSDGTAQYLLSLIDGKSTEGDAEITPAMEVAYDSQVVEDYIAEQDDIEGEPKAVSVRSTKKTDPVVSSATEVQPLDSDDGNNGEDYEAVYEVEGDAESEYEVEGEPLDDGEWQEFTDSEPTEDEEIDF